MLYGQITKGISGLYNVCVGDNIYKCKARGKFRNENLIPFVGDYVEVNIENDGTGIINKIHERKSLLVRPAVANIDNVILVFSLKTPDINYSLLDKFLILIEQKELEVCICINKIDISDQDDIEKVESIYRKAGYTVVCISAKENIGVDKLKSIMKDKINVLAGPSGVGKSSILNKIEDGLRLQIGELSSKTERGKHTTRSVELFKLGFGGYVLDTPGFTSLEIDSIRPEELKYYFKDINEYTYKCKFSSCIHITEPNCAVKQAVERGDISKERYNSYIEMYLEAGRKK